MINGVTHGVQEIHMMGGSNGGNGHMMDTGDMQQIQMVGEEGFVLMDQGGIWDLDGMLWGNLPDGLDMPYDGIPNMDFDDSGVVGFDGQYMMQQ